MPLNPLDYLKSLLQSNPATGGGEDIDLPSETFVGPKAPKPESSPWQKAATIGASKVGERYAEPTNPSTFDLIRRFTAGAERPRSVAAQDPYGIEAWQKGAGPAPGLVMGSTEEVGGEALKKAVAGLKGFYSRVDKTAEDLPSAMHPSKAEGIFKNNAAKEEVDYRGLSDFLKNNQRPKVTKAEIQDHLAAHPMPEIGVKDLGGGEIKQNPGGVNVRLSGEPTKYDRPSLNVPGGENYRERLLTLPSPDDNLASIDTGTKEFAQWHYNHYGTHPIGDDFTDPGTIRAYMANNGIGDNSAREFQSSHWDEPNVLAHSRFDERTLPSDAEARLAAKGWKPVRSADTQDNGRITGLYRPDGGDPEFGPHVIPRAEHYDNWKGRYVEDLDPEVQQAYHDLKAGKGRFLQEVQSDWHQQGKEQGYGDDNGWQAKLNTLKDNVAQTRTHFNDLATELGRKYQIGPGSVMDQIHTEIPDSVNRMPLHMLDDADMQKLLATHSAPDPLAAREALYPEFRQKYYPYALSNDDRQLMQQAHYQRLAAHSALADHQSTTPSTIPDAPFKDSWTDLVLKQHVMDVAQNPDLHWLGFTTGDTQNARYNLAQHVRNFEYNPELGKLDIELHDGGRQTIDVAPNELHQHVGRDMARRIMESPDTKIPDQAIDPLTPTGNWHTVNLSPDDNVTIGGAGMRHYYDKKMTSALSKILKPFGGGVGLESVPGQMPSISATAGRPIYPQGRDAGSPRHFVSHVSEGTEQIASTWPPVPSGPGAAPQAAEMGQNLADLIRAQPHIQAKGKIPGWIAHFPPELKKAIMEKGLSLMTLFGMMQMNQSDQSQAPAGAIQGLKDAR